MRKAAALIALLLVLAAGAVAAIPEPPSDAELVSCDQYRFPDGDCWEICVFRSPTGEAQGYLISRSC